jgi:hypothetical protein
MRETLVPILGENGAVIAQYLITLVVILGLVVAVVWVVRRYALGGVRPAARGRLPRLAIVDALAIDNKRRLVLVRRDNVEHLVLIGGPSDVVVEPSIVRTRVTQRPGQPPQSRTPQPQPSAAGALPPAPPPPPPAQSPGPAAPRSIPAREAPPEPAAAEEPIPFPPRRTLIRAAERPLAPRRETPRPATTAGVTAAAAPAARPAPAPPQPEPAAMAAVAGMAAPPPEAPAPRFMPPVRPMQADPVEEAAESPFVPEPEARPEATSEFAPPGVDRQAASEAAATVPDGSPAETLEETAAPPTATGDPPEGDDTATQVSDLEKEMARLLGEISTNRKG